VRTAPAKRKLPDLSEFRAKLGAKLYLGNSVVDLRDEEQSRSISSPSMSGSK